MGQLIAIEGLDGAGKNTLAEGIVAALRAAGATVAQCAFPRYGSDIHAELARDALRGSLGDLVGSVHGMAVLFALDRRAAAAELREQVAGHDVVLLDRYIASNAAYTAARLHQHADGEAVRWIEALEVERFDVPIPDRQLLLDVPVKLAAQRARQREGEQLERRRDAYETDGDLQERTALAYRELAAASWVSPWTVLGPAAPDIAALAAELRAARP